jgi:hypothetical protein
VPWILPIPLRLSADERAPSNRCVRVCLKECKCCAVDGATRSTVGPREATSWCSLVGLAVVQPCGTALWCSLVVQPATICLLYCHPHGVRVWRSPHCRQLQSMRQWSMHGARFEMEF